MKLKYTFETMELDDEIVAVPIGSNSSDYKAILKLNQGALEIFKLLESETSFEAIVSSLQKNHNNPKEEIITFVEDYLNQLRENGLLAE